MMIEMNDQSLRSTGGGGSTVSCGDGSSAIYLITPIAPLVLSKYRITVTPPAYTGLSPVIEEDQGSMVFP